MSAEDKPRRLCSEIQLFDLCTKKACTTKDGRFCTDEKLLSRFEAINQEDDFPPDRYLADDSGEDGDEEDAYADFGHDFDEDEDGFDDDEET